MTDEQLAAYIEALEKQDRYDWGAWARPGQLPPEGAWKTLMISAGRGYGKSRAAAEMVREWVDQGSMHIGIVHRNNLELREICFESPVSGLLAVFPPDMIPKDGYRKATGATRLTLANGCVIRGFTAEDPDGMRGHAIDQFWFDEFSSFPRKTAQDCINQAWFCMRESDSPRLVITTTPKPVPWIRDLYKRAETDPGVVVRTGRTLDNAANLSPEALAELISTYQGTRLGRQELDGELLLDVEGALWTGDMIEGCRLDGLVPDLRQTLTAVDPSGSADGDACGIVTLGVTADRVVVVLDDATTKGTPESRFEAACLSAARHESTILLYESAYGGDNIAAGLRSAWQHLESRGQIEGGCPRIVPSAIKGDKAARAAPVVSLYEQTVAGTTRVLHARPFPLLETEMTTWVPPKPGEAKSASPNRIDALVHGVRFLTKNLGILTTIVSPNSNAAATAAALGRLPAGIGIPGRR